MVRKTIVAIIAVVLLVSVFVGARQWGYTRYGALYYYGDPFFMYYPVPYYPTPGVYYSNYPEYASPYYPMYSYPYPGYAYPYYGPLTQEYAYRFGAPAVISTPTRSREGQVCGISGTTQMGCEYGLVCDYTKGTQAGLGVCSQETAPYYG
ncbi:hypothetical protein KY309_00360 [Candidatus Woesearchaeota archaeon]|nr:hypothetical protein [Candidatus Woesearchaeota archaeon]MBW3016045.1 hypothetical protein [Candidatus Woesearchaeota archaeon]